MSALSPAAEAAATRLNRILFSLRGMERDAFFVHQALDLHDLAPDVEGCVPDLVSDLIGTVEKQLWAIGAEIPAARQVAA